MKQSDFQNLHNIIEQIAIIENFTYGYDSSKFAEDLKTQYSVVKAIELIAENSNKLSEEFINDNKELPVFEMKGMRNKLIHEYENVDLEIVWNVVDKDLPNLKDIIEKIILKL